MSGEWRGSPAAAVAGAWVHRAAGAMRDTGSAVIGRAEHAGARAGRVAGELWQRNALLVGAIGIVAGALIAGALPSTRGKAGPPGPLALPPQPRRLM
jgi:hypothetical protein